MGQIGDIVAELNSALNSREPQIRDLLTWLNDFVGVLAAQRDAINATVVSLNRAAGTIAGQRDALTRALDRIPPALDVLVAERPRLTTALDKLGRFSAVATEVVNDTRDDLIPRSAQSGADAALAGRCGAATGSGAGVFHGIPYGQATIDRAIRGDYLNQFIISISPCRG